MKKKKVDVSKIVIYVILSILAIIWLYPVAWSILTSFKPEAEIRSVGYSFWPETWTLENYKQILVNNTSTPIVSWFINSLITSTAVALLSSLVIALAAYGYGRLEWKYRDAVFSFVMVSMMFPAVVNLIPLYDIMNKFSLLNNKWSIILPSLASVGNLFLARQFALSIPDSFDESARIDGANHFQIFFYIFLPLLRPILTVVAIFGFTTSWNDLLWPSVAISDIDKLPITPGLQLLQGQYQTFPGVGTAGALIALIPPFILYLFARKYFTESLKLSSGIKA